MDSQVDRDAFLDENDQPKHYFEIPGYPLSGGMAPAFIPTLKRLHKDKVGLC